MHVLRLNVLFSSVLNCLLFALRHLFTRLVGKHLYVLHVTSIFPRPSYTSIVSLYQPHTQQSGLLGFYVRVWPSSGVSPLDSQHGSRSPGASAFGFNLQLVCVCVCVCVSDESVCVCVCVCVCLSV